MPQKTVPVERTTDEHFGVREAHPSFGMIGVCRTQGHARLFGSPLTHHNNYVTLRIKTAERCKSGHGYDFYFGRKDLIEVALSEAQFAQMITSWNSGDGVPCTIGWLPGEGTMPTWPDEDQVSDMARVREEFRERIAEVQKKFEVSQRLVEAILEKKAALTKVEKESVRFGLVALQRLLEDTGPFMAGQFVEVTEKTVQKAMTEIDAFASKVIRQTGLDALQDMKLAGLDAAVADAAPELPPSDERVPYCAEDE